MKKKLVLIALDSGPKQKYIKDLNKFFEEYLEIEGYSIKEGIDGLVEGDLALITSPVLTNMAKKYLPEDIKIIYMNRTFAHSALEPLYRLVPGTKAMMVSNTSIAAIEAISTLYEMGIKHVDFIPVYPGVKKIPDLKIAVTPAQLSYVPSSIEQVIDIGWRVLDLSTLMDIGTKLDIMNKTLEDRLGMYAQTIIPISHGLHSTLNSTGEIKNQMEIVLDVVDDGVIVTDTYYQIIHCNQAICKMLNSNEQMLNNTKLYEKTIPITLCRKLREEDCLENVLVKSPEVNKSFLITKRKIDVYNRTFGYVMIIKDITEIQNLENQLRKQLLEKGYVAKYHFENIAGKSTVLKECIQKAKKIAQIDAPVLIVGESGTGKELFTQSIHNASKRRRKPFVAINCAALPSELLESELFGYEEGAFSGAKKGGKKGLFELAHTGTLFLDEIGDVPINVQVKLLRALQEKEVMRIGGTNIIPIDVRIMAATNQDLKVLIEKGKFRLDLYYRLNVLGLHLPALRDRKEDIKHIIQDILSEIGFKNKKIAPQVMKLLLDYPWKGNVRELRNCIEYMVYMGGDVLTKSDLPEDVKNFMNKKELSLETNEVPELTFVNHKLAVYILQLLNQKNCGRRMIYKYAVSEGFQTSEYEIRKILEILYSKQWIIYGDGRKGAQLTHKGKEFMLGHIHLRDE
ncbi:sigma 54-interacting transcriptional regulator [Clostridiaceae bacterium 35-E11]